MAKNAFSYFKIRQDPDSDDLLANTSITGKSVQFQYVSEDDEPLTVQRSKNFAFEGGRGLRIFEDLHTFAYNDGSKGYEFQLKYNHYRSYSGPDQPSGAYIFRPDNLTTNGSILYSIPRAAKVFVGKNLIQITVI